MVHKQPIVSIFGIRGRKMFKDPKDWVKTRVLRLGYNYKDLTTKEKKNLLKIKNWRKLDSEIVKIFQKKYS
jgi:hypothetical protein